MNDNRFYIFAIQLFLLTLTISGCGQDPSNVDTSSSAIETEQANEHQGTIQSKRADYLLSELGIGFVKVPGGKYVKSDGTEEQIDNLYVSGTKVSLIHLKNAVVAWSKNNGCKTHEEVCSLVNQVMQGTQRDHWYIKGLFREFLSPTSSFLSPDEDHPFELNWSFEPNLNVEPVYVYLLAEFFTQVDPKYSYRLPTESEWNHIYQLDREFHNAKSKLNAYPYKLRSAAREVFGCKGDTPNRLGIFGMWHGMNELVVKNRTRHMKGPDDDAFEEVQLQNLNGWDGELMTVRLILEEKKGVIDTNAVAATENIKAVESIYASYNLNQNGEIKRVNLISCPQLSDDDFDALVGLEALEELVIYGQYSITDEALKKIRHLPSLHTIEINSTNLSGIDLIWLKDVKSLKKLALYDMPINRRGFSFISDIVNLEELTLRKCLFYSYDFLGVKTMPKLRKLDVLVNSSYTGEIWSPQITVHVYKHLRNLRSWKARGYYPDTDDDTKTELLKLSNLQHLEEFLTVEDLTDADLQALGKIPTLKRVHLQGDRFSDQGLQYLSSLEQLELLTLDACPQITDEGVKHLAGLNQLQDLTLNQTQVTEQSLSVLKNLPNLKHVRFYRCNTRWTQASINDAREFKQITSINLVNFGDEITEETLKTEFPGCKVSGSAVLFPR